MNLSQVKDVMHLERNLFKNQIVDLLRSRILNGKLPPGAPLVERELAESLGVSRIPVRDALIQLEGEGLVTTKGNSRCVIELTQRDIQELYQVRSTLENLAVRLAVENLNENHRTVLLQKMEELRAAVSHRDGEAYRIDDVEIHRTLWKQSGNMHLVKALNAMSGPIFMLVARHASHYDWTETLQLHENIIHSILAGDACAAEREMALHTENARERSLRLFSAGLL